MLVNVEGYEKEVVFCGIRGGTYIYRVGRARVLWNKKYDRPYVIIPGKARHISQEQAPLIKEFINEYKRCLARPKPVPPLSFVGEGQMNTPYKYNPEKLEPGYISGVPKWMRELKVKQLCSGPIRTFYRGIRIPQEHKAMCKRYSPICCNCPYREGCSKPCDNPEVKSTGKILH